MAKKASKATESERGLFEKVPDSGVWWIRYTDSQGNYRREKVGRRADAKTLLDKRHTETLQRKKLPEKFRAKAVTFRQLSEDALEHSRHSNKDDSTYELQLKVNALLPVFGDREAETITKQELQRWLASEMTARGWKPSSRNRWQAALSLIFRVGIDNEKITTNPASRIRRKTEDNGRVRYLSTDEETKLREAITNPIHLAAVELSLHTGMRQSEQFSLRWSQVDFDRRQIHLPTTKNGKPRRIPLNANAIAALEVLKKASGREVVFPNGREDNAAVQGARGWFKDAVTRAKLEDYTWHCNRHTFASRLVMAGVDLRTVGELLGHRTAQMTLRYSHLAPEHTASAVDRLVTSGTPIAP
jgi:site-specific recombinase XerD